MPGGRTRPRSPPLFEVPDDLLGESAAGLLARGADVLSDRGDVGLPLGDALALPDRLAGRAVENLDVDREEVVGLADALALAVREHVLVGIDQRPFEDQVGRVVRTDDAERRARLDLLDDVAR